MGKQLAKAAGMAAVEKTLQSLLPDLLKKIESLGDDMRDLRREMDRRFQAINAQFEKIDERFERTTDQFERTQALINELGLRVITVDTKLEAFRDLCVIRPERWTTFANVWCGSKSRNPAGASERVRGRL
jgi:predicted ArsR family transcriptional regulator